MVIDCTRLEKTTNKLLPPTYKPQKQAQLFYYLSKCLARLQNTEDKRVLIKKYIHIHIYNCRSSHPNKKKKKKT